MIPAKYDMIVVGFSKDKVIVKKGDEGLGIVSTDGEVLCKPQFKNLANVTDNIFMASIDDEKWGVIDDKGIFKGAIDYTDSPGGRNMLFYAESQLYDPAIVLNKIEKYIDKINFGDNIATLAKTFNVPKYAYLEGTTHCQLKVYVFGNFGVTVKLYADLNASAVVKQGYWSNRTEFNRNARPMGFTITLTFESQKKCNETYDYLAKANGQKISGYPSTPTFDLEIRPDKSYTILDDVVVVEEVVMVE